MEIPECLDCGACCKVFGIVEVEMSDICAHKDLVVSCELGYCRMKTNGFHCIALQHDNKCSIYETRPVVCRRLQRGGELCKMAIEQMKRIQND